MIGKVHLTQGTANVGRISNSIEIPLVGRAPDTRSPLQITHSLCIVLPSGYKHARSESSAIPVNSFRHLNGCRGRMIKADYSADVAKRHEPLFIRGIDLRAEAQPQTPPPHPRPHPTPPRPEINVILSHIDMMHCYLRYILCIHVVDADTIYFPCICRKSLKMCLDSRAASSRAAMVLTSGNFVDYTRLHWHISTRFEHFLI